MGEASTSESARPRATARTNRILGSATLVFAVLWIGWTHLAAEHVRHTTMTRVFASTLVGGQAANGGSSLLQNLLRGPTRPSATTPAAPPGSAGNLQKQIRWVETAVWYWERIMYTVAAGLILTALGALWKPPPNALWGTAGAAIVACTAVTLGCLWTLISPRFGDLPPLSLWTYVTIAVLQGCPGLLLCAVFMQLGCYPFRQSH